MNIQTKKTQQQAGKTEKSNRKAITCTVQDENQNDPPPSTEQKTGTRQKCKKVSFTLCVPNEI